MKETWHVFGVMKWVCQSLVFCFVGVLNAQRLCSVVETVATVFLCRCAGVFSAQHLCSLVDSFYNCFCVGVQAYLMHNIYAQLLRHVATSVGVRDAQLNKITRNLTSLQPRHVNIKPAFWSASELHTFTHTLTHAHTHLTAWV